jgi:hypothetical protein
VTWTAEEATKMGEELLRLGKTFPVRQMRYEFHRRGTEWKRVGVELEDADEGEAAIELVSGVIRGMSVIGNDRTPWMEVVAINNNGTGLGVDDGDGRTIWRNFYGPTSPVVVRA